jgi:heterodisulfide reductase subunit A-like polyferredoxin
VEEVSGYVGNFTVKVRKKARYVEEDKCISCGLCWENCLTRRIPQLKLIAKGEMNVGERRPGER